MIKLKDILMETTVYLSQIQTAKTKPAFKTYQQIKEEELDFSTELTDVDPETGRITWDVTYETNLDRTYKEIDEAVDRLGDLVAQDKNKDAQELLDLSRLLRNKFSRYRKKYQR